ncbi:MAG: hypothetical protein DVB28_002163, partial [Verrucomicrobia bacterium]
GFYEPVFTNRFSTTGFAWPVFPVFNP